MLSDITSKTTETVKAASAALASAAPRYEKPRTWVPGLRVLLAFFTPMLLGLASGRPGLFVPIGVGAGMLALVDPMGGSIRRAVVIGATTLASALVFQLGALVGTFPPLAVVLMFAVVYAAGLSTELGSAGVRSGLWIVTAVVFGISNSGINPGYFSAPGILIGGAWALFLALVPFRNEQAALSELISRDKIEAYAQWRVSRLRDDLPHHFALRTALGRHALRMASATALGLTLSYLLERPTVGWIAGATVAVLSPQVRLFRMRSASLFIGTALGVAAAWAVARSGLDVTGMLFVSAPLIFMAANLRSVDYASWVTLYSAFNLVMLFVSTGNGTDAALLSTKLIDTALGATIALVVAGVTFPRSERERLDEEIHWDLAGTGRLPSAQAPVTSAGTPR